MSFSIGSILLQGGAWLAPLASVTSAPFRQVCLAQGCELAVTEMVSSEALVRDVGKALQRMERAANESVLVVQLFGGNPETMARAASYAVEQGGANMIDINMGCPARKILGVGAGVALMREPELAARIVEAIYKVCGSKVPVTVKMRAGWDDTSVNAVQVAQAVEQAGAAAITVHGRTREQVHSGQSRWDIIRAVREAVRVPVIGNGGVKTYQDAVGMMQHTGCQTVMIGRAALGNPWIFESLRSGHLIEPSLADRFAVIRKHLALYVEYAGERQAAREMRKHLCWYLRGLPGSSMVRAQLQHINSSQDLNAVLEAYQMAIEQGVARPSSADFGAPAELD